MPFIFAFTTLFVFQLIGEVIVHSLSIPLPGPLAGMLLLFVALIFYKKIPAALDNTATLLIQHLMLLFIPAVTGIMLYFERIRDEWMIFVITGVVATVITLLGTAYSLAWLLSKHKEKNDE